MDDLIQRAREALVDVTPGPWTSNHPAQWIMAGDMHVAGVRGWGYLTGDGHGALGLTQDEAIVIQDANRHFIAAARDLVPAMADRLEAQEALLKEAMEALDERDGGTHDEDCKVLRAGSRSRYRSALPIQPCPDAPQGDPVTLTYTNWRGETADRSIVPRSVWFGSTEWHPEPQWLLRALDVEKQAERDFALKDFGQKPAPVAVRVKPLVFCPAMIMGVRGWVAGGYEGYLWRWRYAGGDWNDEADNETAQAAAEADHAARILSQIDAVPAAQVRAEALEEAAKLQDAEATTLRSMVKDLPETGTDAEAKRVWKLAVTAEARAAAIRALIEKEPT